MRYEDSSQTGAFSNQSDGQGPEARDDLDTVAAGARTPVTGNVISGEGTQFGAASSDLNATDAHVTAIAGTGGQDSNFAGGKLSVTGEFGKLNIDADGNYSYLANKGAPENSRDNFTYTLADKQGHSDTAALTIEIGKTPTVVQANAQQVVVGPDGVVVLPAGVQLSDVHVVGRNLVIDLPDGTQMVIIDGAVFVPQLVLGTVEVPATNLAALLIDAEPRPGAGGPPPSSGGNFGLPPGPLDPGVPLGDLLPPTEIVYTPPEVREVNGILDRHPDITIDPGNGVPVENAVDSVNEAGLPTRNEGEPQGSGEEAAAGANGDPSEATTGTILYNSPDAPNVITINGVVVTGAANQVIAGAFGNLVINTVGNGTITYTYTLFDNTAGNTTHDDFTVVITDNDGDTDTATLTINIVDDVPTARPDTDTISAGTYGPATGNVITDAAAGDAGDGDNGADTVGADNASITAVSSANVPANVDTNPGAGFLIAGQYGVLTLNTDGSYSYTRNQGTPGGVNDVFNYTLTDGDGDTSTTTLTISIADATPQTGPNPTALLDDDAVPLANGNPGGVGDDVDAANLSGNLVASGGDGPLTYDLLLTGAPAGFTYVDGPNGSVLVQQGGTTVLTITINATTGAYTVVQNAPIDHPAGSDENNVAFTINYRVTDVDGDPADGTLNINVDDDTPTIGRADISTPTLTVDETNLALNATGNFAAVFQTSYGADGPGTVTYAVATVNGTDSGLVDVATGQSIFLFNNGGVVEGHVGNSIAGPIAFTVSVNASGVVSLDQVRALDHPSNPNPDDAVSPIASSVVLTATVTDGDGDPANLSLNIGGQLVFKDDGPSVAPVVNANATVTVDESLPSTAPAINTGAIVKGDDPDLAGGFALGQANSGSAVVNANAVFGADGPAATGSIVYALSVINAGSGVTLTDGSAINLVQLANGNIVGVVAGGTFAGQAAFAISIDPATGIVSVEQYLSLDHPVNPNPNDPLGLGANTVGVTVTATDGDGDPISSGALDISGNITFLDDGPTVNPVVNAQASVTVDESLPSNTPAINTGAIVKGDDPDLAGGLALGQANSGSAIVNANAVFGADGPAAGGGLAYALTLTNPASGVTLTDGTAINLVQLANGNIVGVVASGAFAGQAAFAIAIDPATGIVSVEQYLSLDHPVNPNPNDPLGLGANTVGVTVTATDGDGDPVTSNAVDISGRITFLDDGPTVNPVLSTQGPAIVDESAPVAVAAIDTLTVVKGDDPDLSGGLAIGSGVTAGAVINANAVFGADGPAASGSLTYALSVLNAGSGLTLTDGSAINLVQLANGVVVGVVASGAFAGQAAFAISINAGTGVVTVEQYLSLDHPINPNPNDALALAAGSLGATVTATDGDGDPVTSSAVDITNQISFLDDGPAVNPVVNAQATITVDESLPSGVPAIVTTGITKGDDPDLSGGLALGQATSGSAIVNANAVYGADGAALTGSLTYALSVINAPSGVTLTDGTAINLVQLANGNIVGVVAGGTFAGQAAFAISIDPATGIVSFEQYLSVKQPLNPDPNDSIHLGANTVGVTVTATDGDGDPVTSGAVDISGQFNLLDDGPSAQPDVDSIVGGNGPATGNVITGVDIVGGDTNTTDGVADAPGADGASITRIASNNVPANIDTSFDGSGNLVVNGQYGTLTIKADGSYSYLRTVNVGGVSDVFTYTLTDGDGDPVTSTLTIGIEDRFPIGGNVNVQLDDDALAGGNPGGTGDDPNATNVGGTLPGSGGDGTLSFSVQLTGAPAGLTYVSGGAGIVLVQQGGITKVTVTVNSDGTYTVVQNLPIVHAAGSDENNTSFVINYTVTDADGDPAPGTISINVDDDTPTVNVTQTNEGSVLLTTQDAETDGVPTNEDTASSTANFSGVFGLTSSAGADGGSATPLSYTLGVTDATSGLNSHGVAINLYYIGGKVVGSTAGSLGAVTVGNTIFDIGVSGAGVVTLTQYQQVDHAVEGVTTAPFDDQFAILANGKVSLTASSTVTDGDGDSATDQEVIDLGGNIRFADDGPVAVNDTVNQVTENQPITFGVFGNDQFGADGVDTDNIPTVNVTFTQPPIGQGTVSYNAATGQFTFTPASGQQGSTQFTYTITDFDGDTSTATVTVNLQPDSTPAPVDGVASVDDDGLAGGNAASVTGDLNANTGEAAPVNASEAIFHGQLVAAAGGDTITNYTFASMHGTNGTVGTETVLYSWNNVTSTLTATTVGGTRPGTALFQVVVNQATGDYNLTLLDNVLHTAGNNENDATTNLTFTVTDSDGDPANGTIVVTFDDDAPTLGTIQNGTANNLAASAHSIGTLHLAIGADSPASVVGITTGSLTGILSGGKALVTNYNNGVLTAYQDANGNGIYDLATDVTQVFTLTVNPNAGTSGQYDFDLITPIDPTVTETAIGGSSSFGAGPTSQGQVLDNVAGTQHLAVISGYHMGGTFNEATWLATGSAGATTNFVTAGVNGSTAGWGIDNNNFNGTDEMFVWDFGSQPLRDPDGAGAYVPAAGIVLPDISTATFDLIGYNSGGDGNFATGDDITYVVHYTDGTFASGHIPEANVDSGTWKFTAAAGKFIADIEMFASGLGSGKVDLVSVGIQNSSLNQNLTFTVTVQDADGDQVSGGFTLNINTANTPSTAAPPVVLDLNGDGVNFLAVAAGVHYDYNGDGQAEATAWVAPDDGILVRDVNGNGAVDGASEFVFGTSTVSDMQALAAQYGARLDASDADYAKFGVWQDANSNGVVDTGEYRTLAEAGITGINLVSDGVGYVSASGDVEVAGSSTYTKADGSTGIAADATFLTGGRAVEDPLRVAANSNIALAAAVAAAGLAAAPAAATSQTDTSDQNLSLAADVNGLNQQMDNSSAESDSNDVRTAMTNEARESASDLNGAGTTNNGFGDDTGSSTGLTDPATSDGGQDAGTMEAIDQGPALDFSAIATFAPMVAMPAAEALAAAGLAGGVQQGGSVEQVLAEALGGAGAAPTIDALLQSLPGQGSGGNAGLDAFATLGGANVPAWDMGAAGGFVPGADMMFRMDVATLHHDAVQPVVNG